MLVKKYHKKQRGARCICLLGICNEEKKPVSCVPLRPKLSIYNTKEYGLQVRIDGDLFTLTKELIFEALEAR